MSREIRPAPTCESRSPAAGLRCMAIHQGHLAFHYHEHANGAWTLWDGLIEYFKTPDEVEAMAVKVSGQDTGDRPFDGDFSSVRESAQEKPLYVKVAEALGETMKYGLQPWEMDTRHQRWLRRLKAGEILYVPNGGMRHIVAGEDLYGEATRYECWAEVGPLIEEHRFTVQPGDGWVGGNTDGWVAFCPPEASRTLLGMPGETPLLAVCNLIVAIAAEGGKL